MLQALDGGSFVPIDDTTGYNILKSAATGKSSEPKMKVWGAAWIWSIKALAGYVVMQAVAQFGTGIHELAKPANEAILAAITR